MKPNKKQLKVIIEHCGEKNCPECNKKAYEAGWKAGQKDLVDEMNDDHFFPDSKKGQTVWEYTGKKDVSKLCKIIKLK